MGTYMKEWLSEIYQTMSTRTLLCLISGVVFFFFVNAFGYNLSENIPQNGSLKIFSSAFAEIILKFYFKFAVFLLISSWFIALWSYLCDKER